MISSPAAAVDSSPLTSKCYGGTDLYKLSKAITDLQKCQVELIEKNKVIDEKLTKFDAAAAGPQFWQEPSFVVGGVVISFAVGSLVTAYVINRWADK